MNIMRVEAKHGRVDTETTDALVLLLCEGGGIAQGKGRWVILDRRSEGHFMNFTVKGV